MSTNIEEVIMTSVFNNMATIQKVNQPVSAPVKNLTVQDALPASNMNATSDSVEISSQPKKKKGLFKTINSGIANISKSFATFGEYAKGTIKGIYKGASAGALVYTGGQIINKFKTAKFNKAVKNQTLPENAKLKLCHNKLLAGIAVAGMFMYNLWQSSLNVNMKNSEIDHKWTGHQ